MPSTLTDRNRQSKFFHMSSCLGILLRDDDEEFGRDEVEFAGQREEAGVERRFCFGLFEDFAVMEVSVSEDTPEAARERAKMPMREGRDVNPAARAGQRGRKGRCR